MGDWSLGTFAPELEKNGVILTNPSKSGREKYEHVTRVGKAVVRCYHVAIEGVGETPTEDTHELVF